MGSPAFTHLSGKSAASLEISTMSTTNLACGHILEPDEKIILISFSLYSKSPKAIPAVGDDFGRLVLLEHKQEHHIVVNVRETSVQDIYTKVICSIDRILVELGGTGVELSGYQSVGEAIVREGIWVIDLSNCPYPFSAFSGVHTLPFLTDSMVDYLCSAIQDDGAARLRVSASLPATEVVLALITL
ncbi:hypothetical protein H4Q26_012672 [Puccinia striiformis f. sp. tritici PST-130]|nr:hypothetical protein H4Q26_012672 [Puccinia striiformis f. sp. tritici PST-130]